MDSDTFALGDHRRSIKVSGGRAYAHLHAGSLAHNWRTLSHNRGQRRFWAVVKANAYGHGMLPVAKRLDADLGTGDGFAVTHLKEAQTLRQAGIEREVILLTGPSKPSDVTLAARHRLTLIFHSHDQIDWLYQQATPPIRSWVKIDTGMGRLGFSIQEAEKVLRDLDRCPFVDGPVGVMSHWACADDPTHPLNQQQLRMLELLRTWGAPISMSNSSAWLNELCHDTDVVRLGLALYGAGFEEANPSGTPLKPVMHVFSSVMACKKVRAGQTIGYGATYTCHQDTHIAVVAIGYGDGYPRIANGAPALLHGYVCRVVGHVSMDMLTLCVQPCFDAGHTVQRGDIVCLWGEHPHATAHTVARHTQRSPYDLLTGIRGRVYRQWVDR